jgi:hypothetical protein
VQGTATVPVNHNIGPVMSNRLSSISMTDHEESCDSHSTGNNQNPATICTAIGESVQTMRSDVSSSSVGDNDE